VTLLSGSMEYNNDIADECIVIPRFCSSSLH
jgi:hypothetical protein